MTQESLRHGTVHGVSGSSWFRSSLTIWLGLLVIFVGIQFGAGLYEKLVVVPQWAGLPGDRVVGGIESSGMKDAGRVFWPFVSPAVALLAVVNLILAWRSRAVNRPWWLAGAAIMVVYALFSYSFFVPQMLMLQASGGAWSARRIESLVASWTGLNYLRMTLGGAGWLCLLRALSLSRRLPRTTA
ncbi:MAG: DUF1772 domain-containing protein [Actinomycetota bacterium]